MTDLGDDECFFHGAEPPRVTDYRVCGECGHRYRSRHDYVASVHQLCREMHWEEVDDLPMCSLCAHDW